MEHSVKTYMEKMSTDYLKHFLKQIMRGDFKHKYDYLVPEIIDVIMERLDQKESGTACGK